MLYRVRPLGTDDHWLLGDLIGVMQANLPQEDGLLQSRTRQAGMVTASLLLRPAGCGSSGQDPRTLEVWPMGQKCMS